MPPKKISLGNFIIEERIIRNGAPLTKKQHGGNIVPVNEHSVAPDVDGVVVTTQDRKSASMTTADCVPLVLASDTTAVLLHVSRKSIIRGIIYSAKKYVPPSKMKYVYIGPHICRKHFTFEHTGEELKEFCRQFPAACDTGSPMRLSLRRAIQQYFDVWGVRLQQIVEDGRCTLEDKTLPSYRRGDDPMVNYIVTSIRSV